MAVCAGTALLSFTNTPLTINRYKSTVSLSNSPATDITPVSESTANGTGSVASIKYSTTSVPSVSPETGKATNSSTVVPFIEFSSIVVMKNGSSNSSTVGSGGRTVMFTVKLDERGGIPWSLAVTIKM